MLNKVILIGRLTKDPELRATQSNISVASFSLAVERNYKDKQTDFIDIVAWRQTADFVAKYFQKGMQVAVSGSLQTRTWEDKKGQKRTAVEVVADEVYFADSKREKSLDVPHFEAENTSFEDLTDDDGEVPW